MLSKVFEWYRVVHSEPGNDLVAQRTATITGLSESTAKEKSAAVLVDLALAAVHGFDGRFRQDSPLVTNLVKAIRDQQPAFPQELEENKLELRVCAALTLGELFERAQGAKSSQIQPIHLAASLVVAGLSNKPVAGGKHLKIMLSEFVGAALSALEKAATLRRERSQLSAISEKVPEGGDFPTFWKNFQPILKNALGAFQRNATLDREELDVLWWAYNNYSERLDSAFARAPLGLAALACGRELADLVELPPSSSSRYVAKRVFESHRSEKELREFSITDAAKSWDPAKVSAVIQLEPETTTLVRANAPLFPMSWSCLRFLESEGDLGWAAEFKRVSGWDPDQKLPAQAHAIQIFSERVSQRLYLELI